jgi:hypothetical protein
VWVDDLSQPPAKAWGCAVVVSVCVFLDFGLRCAARRSHDHHDRVGLLASGPLGLLGEGAFPVLF